MASSIEGNIITIDAGATLILDLPIASIKARASSSVIFDGARFDISAGSTLVFPNIYGYPGYQMRNIGNSAAVLYIGKFGDVVNRNYFADWRNP